MRAPRFGRRDASLMQIAAAIVGSVGAAQVIRPHEKAAIPHCPVIDSPCPGDDQSMICSVPCRPLPEPDIRCFDPHCPDFGDPSFGEGTCPAEHAKAWRFRFKGNGS